MGEYKGFDDHELVARLADGDARALEVLIERHVHLVEASLAVELRDAWRAEESVASACEECWLQRDRLGQVSSFPSWLYRSARNVALNMKRSEDRDRFRAERFESASRRPATPEEELERTELRHSMWAAMSELSPRRQLAVLLVDLAGLPYAEAGVLMHASINTVKAHLYAGRALLREKLGAVWREYREGVR